MESPISHKVSTIQQLLSLKFPQVLIERLDKSSPEENADNAPESEKMENKQNSKCTLCNSSTPGCLISFSKFGIKKLMECLSVTELKFLTYLCPHCSSVVGELVGAFSAIKELEEKVTTITIKLKSAIKIRETQDNTLFEAEEITEDVDSDTESKNSSLFTLYKEGNQEIEDIAVKNETFDDKMEAKEEFECNRCNQIFRTYIGLMMHSRRKHFIKCSFCPKKLPMDLLPQHNKDVHKLRDDEELEGRSDTDSDLESSGAEDDPEISQSNDDNSCDEIDESLKENFVRPGVQKRVSNRQKFKRELNENGQMSTSAKSSKKPRKSLKKKVKKYCPFMCPVCELKLGDQPNYSRHLKDEHNLSEKDIIILK